MYVSQWRTIWDIRILLRRGTGLQQPTCLSTRYKVPYHIIKSKLIISSICRLWDKRQDNMSIWRSPRYEEKEYHKCCHFLSYIQVSSMFRISLDYITWTYISQTGRPSEALGVSYSLYYSWLDATQDSSEEAPGGKYGRESDIFWYLY